MTISLERINHLPIEVIHAILCFVSHIDLYALAHVDRAWRSMILSPGFDDVWQLKEDEVGFPSRLEQPMTRIQKAHLLWSRQCHDCDHQTDARAQWHLKRILCRDCLKTWYCPPDKIQKHVSNMHALTPFLIVPKMSRRHAYLLNSELDRQVPIAWVRKLNMRLNRHHPPPPNVEREWDGKPCFSPTRRAWVVAAGQQGEPDPELTSLIDSIFELKRKQRVDGHALEQARARYLNKIESLRQTHSMRAVPSLSL